MPYIGSIGSLDVIGYILIIQTYEVSFFDKWNACNRSHNCDVQWSW